MKPCCPLGRLLNAPMRPGTVAWIGLRPARRQGLIAVARAELDPDGGLIGDHYQGRANRCRQVTLIGAEHIAAIGAFLGIGPIEPDLLRRNVVVSGINLHALKGRRFSLGSALLEATGECHPCSRMEQALGVGGYNAVRGQGGVTARIVRAGTVAVGDAICRRDEAD
ncbi:MOSC domain-containing protein [Rhodopila sp.]|uniref:MOSC domain-containing protein n=1 Tax=Rhodopila sp. TaxID=2480087 RepID=UPI003D0DE506